jgi:hypothetical protein
MEQYTTLAAQEVVYRKERVPLSKLLFSPPWTFFRTYVLQRGFLDGFEGLAIAYMAAFYTFMKYSKARVMGGQE